MITKQKDSSSNMKLLHWLPIKARIDFKVALITFKCLNGMAPKYLCDLLKPNDCVRITRRSSLNLLHQPRWNLTSCGKRRFSVYAPILWNSLPEHVKNNSHIVNFKKSLNIFEIYFEKKRRYIQMKLLH